MKPPRLRPPAAAGRQRGAALLTALAIVTLVATLAAAMVWQQWRAVEVEAALRARAQATWLLSGALDWARLILREDAREGGPDHLGEPWAVPLAEARLSTFIAADKEHTDDAPDVFFYGSISDAQARYNVRNLMADGKPVAAEAAAFQTLCASIGVAPEVAARIAEGLRAALAEGDESAAPIAPRRLADLAWLGVDEASLQRMAPYIVVLPRRTPVNLNTAPREVVAAVIEGLDLASAERLVQTGRRNPYHSVAEAARQLGGRTLDTERVAIASNFFEIRGGVRYEDRVVEEISLVERKQLDVVPISRESAPRADAPR